MSTETWSNLPKSQDDNETIEEAINRLIQNHDDDSNAHLDSGQSLQSHKASSIIDHLATSIVADKIGDHEVPTLKRDFDRLEIQTALGDLNPFETTTSEYGSISAELASLRIETMEGSGNYGMIEAEAYATGMGVDYNKNPEFRTVFMLDAYTSDEKIHLVAGDGPNGNENFGFRATDDKLYAIHSQVSGGTTTEYSTEILTLSADTWYDVNAIYTSGSKIEFYVDGTLKATHTSNLPEDGDSAGNAQNFFTIRQENTTYGGFVSWHAYTVFSQDF